jgi:copper resistance protein C
MRPMKIIFRAFAVGSMVAACWLVFEQPSSAHAVLLEATPSANSRIQGPDVTIKLRFNSRIDPDRSRLTLALPDGTTRKLQLQTQNSPDTLTSQVTGLKAGTYDLRWQVLAIDGHITRGELFFEVR